MKFDNDKNYLVLASNADKEFLTKFSSYLILDNKKTYQELKNKLEFFPSTQVVFNESFYNLTKEEINNILNLLRKQNIKFILITTNIEYSIYTDYIYVYDNLDLVLEGNTKEVLDNEKKLKQLGFGLPFSVDLSKQLIIYEVLDKVYYNTKDLAEELWN